ncbi:beta-N-acetylglucosaminidase domain-containing protein [Hyphococcus sp. DH-69]|uniref:beta-N-acetylglucosaminidase domain-containing protein n=1 Tax=Hyphococcus formosus TaxID=3143534 RepID=UPI00398B6175
MVSLGIVEGFFGPRWSPEDRTFVMRYLAESGYRHYLYAPKADQYLRKNWKQPYPKDELAQLKAFASSCRKAGVRFGVGLSPFELYKSFDQTARETLRAKLDELQSLDLDELAIFFDDMRGDLPDLAARQIEIMEFAADHSASKQISFCPTYYSDDAALDRVFGKRPGDYLEALGLGLRPEIDIFWTGEEVCAREISPHHMKEIGTLLRRKPTLWDNYPVNDGPVKSQNLHIRGFTGRPAENKNHIARHMVNPALQPHLSIIPALTLAESYARGGDYKYSEAAYEAAIRYLGQPFATQLKSDLIALNDTGRDRLGAKAETLRAIYAKFDHPAAREILSWLDGKWENAGVEMEID